MTDLPDWKALTSDERARLVTPLAAEGLSATQIACQFTNATRNMVIGLCSRRKITLKGAPVKPPAPPRDPKPRGKRPTLPMRPMPVAQPPITGGIPFISVDSSTCRWPLWDHLPADASTAPCCGEPAIEGKPYCEHHTERARGRGTESERDAHRVLKRHAA